VKPALAIFFLLPGIAFAQATAVVPISQSLLPDGDIRYSVPLRVGDSVPVDALLDTGSTGLRVMRGALFSNSFTDTGFLSSSSFSAGDQLTGTVGTAVLTLGGVSTDGPIPFEIVDHAGCMATRPDCGAAKLAPTDYGIGGDGIAGQGFQAILGVGLRTSPGAENPLAHIGAKQWIIELPQPGASATGQLILNPGWQALQGFTMFTLTPAPGGVWHDQGFTDTLPACLNNSTNSQNLCGPAILDTGAPGIVAYRNSGGTGPLWTPGDKAALAFGGISLPFTVDSAAGTGLLGAPGEGGGISIVAGILPFFSYDVFYDAAGGRIGLKPRDDAAAAPAQNAGTTMQVIQLNAPPPGAPKLPNVITP
jgi:hypothetical protein